MNKFFNSLLLLTAIVWGLGGCEADETVYSGPEYVMFSDSVAVMPIFNKDTIFKVNIASTVSCDYDRTFAVEVLDAKSNAVQGQHYELLEHNVTIKAGERAGFVTMKGHYDNIGPKDSLSVCLKLVEDQRLKWGLYPDEMYVELVKCYPFDIEAFTDNIRMYATFPFSSSEVKTFLLKAEKKDDRTLILKEAFAHNYDLKLKFDDSDPLNPVVNIPSQVGFVDGSYGLVYVRTVETSPSVYSISDRIVMLQLEFYIPGVGSFGVHKLVLQWITQEEADYEKNDII